METFLRAWSAASLGLLVLGMAMWLRAPHGERTEIALGAGLVLLMTTPVLKLLSVLADEIRARDWRFALLGVAVLMLLGGSVMLALR
jgi:predicted permease